MNKLVVNKIDGKRRFNSRDLLFCILLLIWPTIQFGIFYIGVNANSFLLLFRKIDLTSINNKMDLRWEYFLENFEKCKEFFKLDFLSTFKYSVLFWAFGVAVGSPLALLFSYYIFKKLYGSSFFRVILYLPSIISSLILVLLYKNFLNFPFSKDILGISYIFGSLNYKSQVIAIMFFNTWSSFGTSVLMYTNAMTNISPEVIESAELDGAKGIKEFWHIIFPMIFSTWSVFFVNTIAVFFTNQFNLFSFFGTSSDEIRSIGYYMFKELNRPSAVSQYPKLAFLGIIFSAVAIPVTLTIRKLLEKFGPSTK